MAWQLPGSSMEKAIFASILANLGFLYANNNILTPSKVSVDANFHTMVLPERLKHIFIANMLIFLFRRPCDQGVGL